MIKCDNCNSLAVYEFSSRGAEPAFYCEPCVPWTLTDLAAKGNLPKINQPEVTEIAPAPEAVAESTPEEVAPEAVATDSKTSSRKKKTADTPVDAAPAAVSEDASGITDTENSDQAGPSGS